MQISPFEVKDALIELAASQNDRMMLNAGRGNPNWVSTEPRHGFWQLGRFATIEAEMKRLVRNRLDTLYRSMGVVHEPDMDSAGYYAELTLDGIAKQLYSKEFEDWLLDNIKPGEVLYRIADEAGVVLMPGRGFGDQAPSARVSLANLNESDYAAIGKAVRKLLDDYYDRYQAKS